MNFTKGQRVQGNYFGAAFTGTIEHARPHTMNHLIVVHIDLDAPVTVFDLERSAIAMEVSVEGISHGACGRIAELDPITEAERQMDRTVEDFLR